MRVEKLRKGQEYSNNFNKQGGQKMAMQDGVGNSHAIIKKISRN